MIRQVPFQAAHLAALHPQPHQGEVLQIAATPVLGDTLEQSGVAFTGVNKLNQVLVCAGAIPIWPGRATGWAVLSLIPPREWPQLHKLVVRGLDGLQRDPAYRRLEVCVIHGFTEAHRWALLLGFEVETALARRYDSVGRDYVLYVRLR